MPHRVGILAALALWAAPLAAQVGLASAGTTIALSARKPAALAVSLAGIAAAGPRGGIRVSVTTSWSLDPGRTGPVVLVARVERPASGPAGGAKRAEPRGSRGIVLFRHPVGPGNSGGRTDELHLDQLRSGTLDLRVITQ